MVMNKNCVLFFLFVLFSCQVINAQTNYLDGYILLNEKDTVFGKIDNRAYSDNSLYCDFKKSETDSVTRYYPGEIYGYRFVNGKYYISKDVEIDNKQVRLFFEYLINGNLDIYFFMDEANKGRYFASKESLPLKELKYSEKTTMIDGKLMLDVSKEYVGLLTYFTMDCEKIRSEIPKMNEVDHKKLIRFAEKYHSLTCKDGNCIIYEKQLSRKIKVNAVGGSSYFFNDLYDTNGKVHSSYGFSVLFQQYQKSEKVYLGIGLYRMSGLDALLVDGYQIPVSISYFNPRMGLSPYASYDLDLNYGFIVQALKLGLNYQMKKMSILLYGDFKTLVLIKPFGTSINFGFSYDLR